jgi:hypothetical protein
MSFADSPSLELERQPRSEYFVTAIVLLIALVVPWLLPLQLTLRGTLVALVIGLATATCWWNGLIGPRRIARATWDNEGRWWLFGTDGGRSIAELDADTRVLPGLIWLHWRSERGARHMLLWRGAMSPAVGRQLAARLRLQNMSAADSRAQRKLTEVGEARVHSRATAPGP